MKTKFVSKQRTMMKFAVTEALQKDLLKFKQWGLENNIDIGRYKDIIHKAIHFVSGALPHMDVDRVEVKEAVAAAKRVHTDSKDIKGLIPFDYESCKDDIENIKKTLDIPNDYWAIWFAVEFYIIEKTRN